jgi:hypothetical protein
MKDNQTYYFEIGAGRWRGRFSLRVTSWSALWHAPIGAKNRLLATAMAVVIKLGGSAALDSVLGGDPDRGPAGVATNVVRISKLGLTVYLLRESYTLDEDGTGVGVEADERFGPLPGILQRHFRYPAVIHTAGMSSTYYMPLLGADWTASYQVDPDRRHIAGRLVCPWAEASETIVRSE